MKKFSFTLFTLFIILGSTIGNFSPLLSQEATENNEPKGYIINFNNVNIVEYIRFISKISDKNFIFDEKELDFNVTIVSEELTDLDNIMAILLQILQIHDLQLLEQENNLIIHKNLNVKRPSKVVSGEAGSSPFVKAEFITRIYRINTLSPGKLEAIIKPMLSSQARIEVLEDSNHLIITDISTNIKKITDIINIVDKPNATMKIGQYLLKETSVSEGLDMLNSLMSPLVKDQSFILLSHPATQSIFIVSSPFLVERALAVLKIIDSKEGITRVLSFEDLVFSEDDIKNEQVKEKEQQDKEEEGIFGGDEDPITISTIIDTDQISNIFDTDSSPHSSDRLGNSYFNIVKLQFRSGEALLPILENISNNLEDNNEPDTELTKTLAKIQWLESSNSLILTGSKESIERAKILIKELDTPSRQVFIEMLILDTSITNSLNFGIQWGGRITNSNVSTGGGFSSGDSLNTALNAITTAATPSINSAIGNAGLSIGAIGKVLTFGGSGFGTIGGLVNAIHEDTDTNIIMNPQIITEDGVQAELFVGFNTAFRTNAELNEGSTIVTENFEFRDVGASLKVTPFLGSSDIITLNIEQQVTNETSALTTTATNNIGSKTSKATTKTRVHVPNNNFVILSGMIQNQKVKSSSKIPCLGGAPILGSLFGSSGDSTNKRNLMIFIRPYIVDTAEQYEDLTHRKENIFKDKSQYDNPRKYEIDTTIDFLNF